MKSLTLIIFLFTATHSWSATNQLASITLIDNAQIIPVSDILEITLDQNKHIDLIELKAGEIFYGFEVSHLSFKKKEQPQLKMIGSVVGGGDGSGGGFSPTR